MSGVISPINILMVTQGVSPGSTAEKVAMREISLLSDGRIKESSWLEKPEKLASIKDLTKLSVTASIQALAPLKARSTVYPMTNDPTKELEILVGHALAQGFQIHSWSSSQKMIVSGYLAHTDHLAPADGQRLIEEFFGEALHQGMFLIPTGLIGFAINGCVIRSQEDKSGFKRLLEQLAFITAAIDRNAVMFGAFGEWLSVRDYVEGRLNELTRKQREFCWSHGFDAPGNYLLEIQDTKAEGAHVMGF